MNCKQGDIAYIANAMMEENLGKVVTCLRLVPAKPWTLPDMTQIAVPSWEIDISVKTWEGREIRFIRDSQLRPIGNPGNDAVDETLLWLPKPVKERV